MINTNLPPIIAPFPRYSLGKVLNRYIFLPLFGLIVRRRRLSLFGHVARMPDNVPAKAVLRVACDVRDGVPPFPNWRRSRGRPSITWLHQICSDCGLSAGDALNCAQDRAAWRTYATASSALRWRRRRFICVAIKRNVFYIYNKKNLCTACLFGSNSGTLPWLLLSYPVPRRKAIHFSAKIWWAVPFSSPSGIPPFPCTGVSSRHWFGRIPTPRGKRLQEPRSVFAVDLHFDSSKVPPQHDKFDFHCFMAIRCFKNTLKTRVKDDVKPTTHASESDARNRRHKFDARFWSVYHTAWVKFFTGAGFWSRIETALYISVPETGTNGLLWLVGGFSASTVSTFAICYRPSACLSSVCNVRGPTQAIEIFGNVCTLFGTMAICDLSIKILRRSSQPKRGSQI